MNAIFHIEPRGNGVLCERWLPLATSLAAGALALAACSSGTSSSSGAGSKPSPGSGSNPSASVPAAATELVNKWTMAQDTWSGPPSAPKPLKGITIGLLPCGLALQGCSEQTDGAKEAAAALGWRTVVVDGQLDTQKTQQAFDTLINQHVNAIFVASIASSSISAQIARAKAAGIPVISGFSSDPRPYGGSYRLGIDDELTGEVDAAYVLQQGCGGGIIEFTSEENPQILARSKGFEKFIKENGGDCKIVKRESIPFSAIGQQEQQIFTPLLQQNPKTTWIFAGFDAMLRPLIQAAQNVGNTNLKGLASDGDVPSLDYIRSGTVQVATIGYPLSWTGWGAVDDINRVLQKKPAVEEGIKFRLLTKSSLPPKGKPYDGDLDYRAKYKSLWGLG